MKRQIRQNVFETNSSSMHSLVIKKQDEYFTPEEIANEVYIYKDGTWAISFEEDLDFGRYPFQMLSKFTDKVKYTIASMCVWKSKKEKERIFKDIENIVKEYVPNIKEVKLPTSYDYETKEDKPYYGYVDEDILTGFLEKNKIDLKEFLTNKKYVVICDGDEYCTWIDIKKSGLIALDEIEYEYGNE